MRQAKCVNAAESKQQVASPLLDITQRLTRDRGRRLHRMHNSFFALTLLALPFSAHAEYPERTLRLVVPFPPGGGVDIPARAIAPPLAEILKQPVVVENRSGAGGSVGAASVARAAADGYTILLGSSSTLSVAPSLYGNLPYHPVRDFAAISMVEQKAYVLVAHPALPAKNIAELLALARRQPGRITIASSGVGSSNHMVGELIQLSTGTRFTHIPYKGSAPAMIELMGGQVDLHVDQVMSAISYVRSGKVRALAVTSRAKRSPQLPDTPTFDEAGVSGFEASGFTGLVAPAGTPPEVISKLNAAIHRVLAQPAIRDFMTGLGSDVVPGTPEELGNYIRSDLARWTGVVKKSGIKLDP